MSAKETKDPMTREEAVQLAQAYMEKHKCRWSEACLEIKRRYPESRALLGAPPKEEKSQASS